MEPEYLRISFTDSVVVVYCGVVMMMVVVVWCDVVMMITEINKLGDNK